MFNGGVVHHHIEDDFHPAFMDFFYQLQGISHRPVFGGDGLIIGDVVSEVRLRRGEEGRAPDGFKSQIADVVQLLKDALNVADAVAVAVVERARVNLIDRCFVVPGLVAIQGSFR